MGDGDLLCSLYLSPKVLPDSPIYSSPQSPQEGSLQNPYLMSSYGNVTHCNRDMLRLHMEHSITEAKYPIQPDLVPDSVASTQTSLPNFPLTS